MTLKRIRKALRRLLGLEKQIDILIVEDEEDISFVIAQALMDEGYGAREARNGILALEELDKARPDLIIMDVMMPGMNGIELCRRVKRRDKTIPVIMLTAKSLIADVEDGVKSGADDYIVKPFDLAKLIQKVEMYTNDDTDTAGKE